MAPDGTAHVVDGVPTGPGSEGRPLSVLALTKSTGGTAFYNRIVLEGLMRTRPGAFDSHTLCLSEQADAYARDLQGLGLSAEAFAMSRYGIDPMGDLRVVRRVGRLLRGRGADVVICHGSKAGFIGRAVGARLGVPVIYCQASLPFQRRIQGWKAPLYGAFELGARLFRGHIVALTESARSATLRARLSAPARIDVIRTGIDVERFRPRGRRDAVVAEFGLDPARPVVGWIGRLEKQKAPLDLVAAIERVAARRPDAQFAVAGEGRLDGAVRARLEGAGLSGRVRLLPWQSDPARTYEGFDIMAMTSLWEGLPLTLLEAMASGAVPASTDVDGCTEVVEDGVSGRLVGPADPDAMAGALDDLLDRHADGRLAAMRAAARRRVVARYSRDRMVAEWAALIERIAAGAGRSDAPSPRAGLPTGAAG